MNLVWRSDFQGGSASWTLAAALAAFVLSWPGAILFYRGLTGRPGSNGEKPDGDLGRWGTLLAVLTLAWGLWGHSLAFAPAWGTRVDAAEGSAAPGGFREMTERAAATTAAETAAAEGRGGLVGGLDFAALRGVTPLSSERQPVVPALNHAAHVPHAVFALFHLTLFVAAAAPLVVILRGRLGPTAAGLFAVVWGTVVYAPLAHAVWGRGWLAERGALDVGGGLIHVGTGFSALACLLVRRHPDPAGAGTGGSVDAARCIVGAGMIWAGSLAAHAALALPAVGAAAMSAFNTQVAAAAGLIGWVAAERFVFGRSGPLAPAAGAATGVAAIAAGCGVMVPQSALLVGVTAGAAGGVGFRLLKAAASGPAAVFTVLGIGGSLGMLLTGVFVTSDVAGVRESGEAVDGLIEGNADRLGIQALAALAAAAYSFAATAALLLPFRFMTRLSAPPGGDAPSAGPAATPPA